MSLVSFDQILLTLSSLISSLARVWRSIVGGLSWAVTGRAFSKVPPLSRWRLYIDPADMERARRSEIEFRADPEGAHGRVMSSGAFARAHMPPPVVNTKVNVYVDGKFIPSTSRVINDSSGFDGRADPPYPDITSWR